MPAWLRALVVAVRRVLPADFVGQVRINCFKGNVSTVTVEQTYKESEDRPGG